MVTEMDNLDHIFQGFRLNKARNMNAVQKQV